MSQLSGLVAFWGTDNGLTLLGLVAAGMIALWDWRVTLVGLVVIQAGVAAATVTLQTSSSEWAGVVVVVMGLSALMLALSARRPARLVSHFQAGTLSMRGLLLLLLYYSWSMSGLELPLPEIAPQLADLFVWLTLCVLLMLGLSDSPLFTTAGLLLWLIPAQAMVAVLVDASTLVALIGVLSLMLALAGSYLIVVEQAAVETRAPLVTDVAFPSSLARMRIRRAEALPVAGASAMAPRSWWQRRGWWLSFGRGWLARLPANAPQSPSQNPSQNPPARPSRPRASVARSRPEAPRTPPTSPGPTA